MKVIDCKRLLCPMPVIRVQDMIATMNPGDELEAICTDPGVVNDIPAWCRVFGHKVIKLEEGDGEYRIAIKVGAE